ncbi:MAG: hypothetical protein K0R89_2870 [Ramlibacter sp.]|nr:hypothetical protein [Ramlibacter sp.]
MNRKSLVFAAIAVSVAGFAAHAETPDVSGQFAQGAATQVTRTQVQADLNQYRQAGVNPWSTSYNPLKGFRSERSRAEVQAEYIASRDAVSAMTAEDSGSAYLAAHKPGTVNQQLAGQPTNAQ